MATIPPGSSAYGPSDVSSDLRAPSTLGSTDGGDTPHIPLRGGRGGDHRSYLGLSENPAAQLPSLYPSTFGPGGVLSDINTGVSYLLKYLLGDGDDEKKGLPLVSLEEAKRATAGLDLNRNPEYRETLQSDWQVGATATLRDAIFKAKPAHVYDECVESEARMVWFWESGRKDVGAAAERIAARGNAVL